jgi:hypothetical protein
MKLAKGSNKEAAIKRQKARDYAKHWDTQRSAAWHDMAFREPYTGKCRRRLLRERKLSEIYARFYTDPVMQDRIDKLELGWAVVMAPRMVRDTVLGTPSARAKGVATE